MRRIFYSMIMMLALLGIQFVPAKAAKEGVPYVVDDAELLSDGQETALNSQLQEISNRQSCDVVVVTVTSIGTKSMMEFADDYYDENGYGMGSDNSGILLLIKMEPDGHGDYWMSTCGYGITAFTDAGIDYIGENLVEKLADKKYLQAFDGFAVDCDKFLTQAKSDVPYDYGNMPKKPMDILFAIVVSVGGGFILALIVVLIMRGQLKSVRFQAGASDYMKPGSMNVTESNDIFLYSTVSKRAKPKSSSSGGSSTHRSSSGARHGGGGGRF